MDGNEIVDSLAKNVTTNGQILEFPLAHTDVWASTHLLQHNSTVSNISGLRCLRPGMWVAITLKIFLIQIKYWIYNLIRAVC